MKVHQSHLFGKSQSVWYDCIQVNQISKNGLLKQDRPPDRGTLEACGPHEGVFVVPLFERGGALTGAIATLPHSGQAKWFPFSE